MSHWEILRITEEDRKTARKLGRRCHQVTGIKPSTRIFTEEAGMQDYIGQLGQYKFHHWLLSENITHEYHTFNLDGYGDTFDFRIGRKTIDVDTAHNKYIDRNGRIIPDEELHFLYYWKKPIDKFDFVVGIMLNKELTIAKIMGYLSKSEVKRLPIGVFGKQKARYCDPLKLHPIKNLFMPKQTSLDSHFTAMVTDEFLACNQTKLGI